MNKKALYESIMKNVAKEVKKALKEGAWGKAPMASDAALDLQLYLVNDFLNIFILRISRTDNTDKLWGLIGNFIRFVKELSLNTSFDVSYNTKSDILKQVLYDALDTIEKDTYWQKQWRNPEEWPKYFNKVKKDIDTIFEYFENCDKKVLKSLDFTDDKLPDTFNNSLEEGECCGSGDCFGGVSMPYNTTMNTIGVGNVVAPGNNGQSGSGDLFVPIKKPAIKKGAKQFRKRK